MTGSPTKLSPESDDGGARTSDYHYDLPDRQVARYPAEARDGSRLLVLDREVGDASHMRFADLPSFFGPGDALIVNESRVQPVRFLGRRSGGGAAEVFLLSPRSDLGAHHWEALVRPGRKLKPGRRVEISTELTIEILESTPKGGRVVRLEADFGDEEAMDRFGHVPLPPYIDRPDEPSDRTRYQTIYARVPGSVAAPTAGLHFTEPMLETLTKKGVQLGHVALHVGVGTFRPVDTEDPAEHHMHFEDYTVPPETVALLRATRERGGRVWAVGTTVVRTLESAWDPTQEQVRPGTGRTDLFIRPGFRFRAIDALITNFHLPGSTLMMLVAAFAGYRSTMRAYREAVDHGYRFFSYGDAMLIRSSDLLRSRGMDVTIHPTVKTSPDVET